jgi:hypothetical protein
VNDNRIFSFDRGICASKMAIIEQAITAVIRREDMHKNNSFHAYRHFILPKLYICSNIAQTWTKNPYMIRLFLAALLGLCFCACNEKQTMDPDKVRIVNLCESFMQNFRDSKLINAMDILRNNSIMSKETIESLYNTIVEQETVFRRYGNMKSYEFIEEKNIVSGLAKRYYILRFEHYYSIFQFTIYKSANGWRITHFSYNDELGELLN